MATDRKLIREEAVALLEAVSQRAPVPVERARQFARAVLELDPMVGLALAVLDDGPFTGARLVELAEAVAHHCQY